jgi:hypothetical protein
MAVLQRSCPECAAKGHLFHLLSRMASEPVIICKVVCPGEALLLLTCPACARGKWGMQHTAVTDARRVVSRQQTALDVSEVYQQQPGTVMGYTQRLSWLQAPTPHLRHATSPATAWQKDRRRCRTPYPDPSSWNRAVWCCGQLLLARVCAGRHLQLLCGAVAWCVRPWA